VQIVSLEVDTEGGTHQQCICLALSPFSRHVAGWTLGDTTRTASR